MAFFRVPLLSSKILISQNPTGLIALFNFSRNLRSDAQIPPRRSPRTEKNNFPHRTNSVWISRLPTFLVFYLNRFNTGLGLLRISTGRKPDHPGPAASPLDRQRKFNLSSFSRLSNAFFKIFRFFRNSYQKPEPFEKDIRHNRETDSEKPSDSKPHFQSSPAQHLPAPAMLINLPHFHALSNRFQKFFPFFPLSPSKYASPGIHSTSLRLPGNAVCSGIRSRKVRPGTASFPAENGQHAPAHAKLRTK